MKRLAFAALVAAGALTPSASAEVLTVRTTFDTPTVEFGEAIRTHVVVLLDRSRVRPGSVRIVADPGPLTLLSRGRSTRTVQGNTLVVALDRTAACISSPCVATGGDATPALPRVAVTATARDGRTLHAGSKWPVLHVRGRVSPSDLARARPPFRVDTAPGPPSYRIAPSTLAWLLAAAAGALALAAVAVTVRQALLLRARRHRAAPEDALERALRLAREAESRPSADRRRALGLLARLLAGRDRRLAATASDLAWARPAPERDALAALVGNVEREVES